MQLTALLRASVAWGCAAATLALVLAGPAQSRVTAAERGVLSQTVDDGQLQAVAHAALSTWLVVHGYRFEIESLAGRAELRVPAGHIDLLARPLSESQTVAPRMQVWVDIQVDGRFVRSQPVAANVHAYKLAWVATDDVALGHDLKSAPFERREIDVAAARTLPIDGALPPGRLRSRVLKGEALAAAQVEGQPAVLRGSAVTLRARLGEIGIESRGEALQDGQPGQRIWVKVATSTGPVLAQVVSEGVVEIQP